MRSFLMVVCCLAVALRIPVSVDATTCEKICETTDLWGTGSESIGYKECPCTDSTTGAARTGPECGCGVCYQKRGSHIFGQGRANGACPAGMTACDDCEVATTTATATTAPTSVTSATDSPATTLTPSSTASPSGASTPATGNEEYLNLTSSPTPASNATASSNGSLNGSSNVPGGNAGSPPATNSSSSGSTTTDSSDSKGALETWQIALIIGSAVLVIAVVMITITSCYCKASNRIKDNELIEEETREYENYWRPGSEDDDRAGGKHLTNSGFGASLTQGGRSSFNSTHSGPNSTKNIPYEPTYGVDDRIGAGRSHRGSLGSNADLPGSFQPFQPRERPSHEVGSRKNIAIEL